MAPERQAAVGPSLQIDLAPNSARGLRMSSPVLGAPVCDEDGKPVRGSLTDCGALVTKTVTLDEREGNPSPRLVRTPSGWLNSMGLRNPGAEAVLRYQAPNWASWLCPVVVSIAAHHPASWTTLASRFDGLENVAAIEANLSCPNVAGGLDASIHPKVTHETVKAVRRGTSLPVIAKLSPNVTDIRPIALAAEDAGAHALSMINTVRGLVIDTESGRPYLGAGTGGLSGPAIRPIALRFVYEVADVVSIPVIGMGGVESADDALQFLMAGASAVQVGTARFNDPNVIQDIASGLRRYLSITGFGSISDVVGLARADESPAEVDLDHVAV